MKNLLNNMFALDGIKNSLKNLFPIDGKTVFTAKNIWKMEKTVFLLPPLFSIKH